MHKKVFSICLVAIFILSITSCKPIGSEVVEETLVVKESTKAMPETTSVKTEVETQIVADVVSVVVSGEESNYQFSVGISSPDTGCNQYADWWEVLTEDGKLIYRRILAHSHVDEQPFVRSGGPVNITGDTAVIIRAHMNPTGYGGKAMKGTVEKGFGELKLDKDFASEVENQEPQPGDCAF
jgi:hypothetical protein